MREQPRIDAIRVENVVAFREQADAVAVLELGEAHGALDAAATLSDSEVLHGEDRALVDELAVEATGAEVSRGCNWASGAATVGVGAVAEVEGDEAHDEEDGEEG